MNSKFVVVTGGAGLIGSKLSKFLLDEGKKVLVVDNLSRGSYKNIENLESSKFEFQKIDINKKPDDFSEVVKGADYIYHLAAKVAGVKETIRNEENIGNYNSRIDNNVFNVITKNKISGIYYMSTACVYNVDLQAKDKPSFLLKPENSNIPTVKPESLYGLAKLNGEAKAAFLTIKGIKVSIGRGFNIYGPGEAGEQKLEDSHVIPALSKRALLMDDPFIVWGDGNQTRSFTYVDDAARAIILASKKIFDATVLNIGTSNRIKILKLAEKVIETRNEVTYHKEKPNIFVKPEEPIGVYHRAADITQTKKILNWEPETSLKEGLKKTMLWYIEHPEAFKRNSWNI